MKLLAGLLIALVFSAGLLIGGLALLHIDPGSERATVEQVPDIQVPAVLDVDPAPFPDPSPARPVDAAHDRSPQRYSLTGKTVPDIEVVAVSRTAGPAQDPVVRNTKSAGDGSFGFANLRAGAYELRIWTQGELVQRNVDLTHDLDVELFDVRIPKLQLSLRVAGAKPEQLADTVVRLVAGGRVLGEGRTDATGVVELQSVPAVVAECIAEVGTRELSQPVDLSKRPERVSVSFER